MARQKAAARQKMRLLSRLVGRSNRSKVAKHSRREPPNKTDYDALSSDLTQHGWMQADMQPFSTVATCGSPVGSPTGTSSWTISCKVEIKERTLSRLCYATLADETCQSGSTERSIGRRRCPHEGLVF